MGFLLYSESLYLRLLVGDQQGNAESVQDALLVYFGDHWPRDLILARNKFCYYYRLSIEAANSGYIYEPLVLAHAETRRLAFDGPFQYAVGICTIDKNKKMEWGDRQELDTFMRQRCFGKQFAMDLVLDCSRCCGWKIGKSVKRFHSAV